MSVYTSLVSMSLANSLKMANPKLLVEYYLPTEEIIVTKPCSLFTFEDISDIFERLARNLHPMPEAASVKLIYDMHDVIFCHDSALSDLFEAFHNFRLCNYTDMPNAIIVKLSPAELSPQEQY